jgi:hypothetical protein
VSSSTYIKRARTTDAPAVAVPATVQRSPFFKAVWVAGKSKLGRASGTGAPGATHCPESWLHTKPVGQSLAPVQPSRASLGTSKVGTQPAKKQDKKATRRISRS